MRKLYRVKATYDTVIELDEHSINDTHLITPSSGTLTTNHKKLCKPKTNHRSPKTHPNRRLVRVAQERLVRLFRLSGITFSPRNTATAIPKTIGAWGSTQDSRTLRNTIRLATMWWTARARTSEATDSVESKRSRPNVARGC